jgi:hypothetical protein
MYDKFGLILRIETTVNDVCFFPHYREVEQRDGTRLTKWTHMKKSLYSLTALREALRAANRRYLEFVSTLADPSAGVEKLRKLSQTVIEHERSYPGFNLFCEEDQQLMQALARGEFNIRGLQNRTLRLHGFIKKVGRTYHYYLKHHPKAYRRHGEEVDRDQIAQMVVQESPPRLGRGFRLLGINRETVCSEISMPSLSNSP